MLRFTVSALHDSSTRAVGRMGENLPLTGEVVDTLTDPEGDPWFWAVLDAPMKYRVPTGVSGATNTPTTQVVLRPHYEGEVPSPDMRSFPMDLAVVLDPDMRGSDVLDLDRIDFLAVVEVDGDTEGSHRAPSAAADTASDQDRLPHPGPAPTAGPVERTGADPGPESTAPDASRPPTPDPSTPSQRPGEPASMMPLPQAPGFAPESRAEAEQPIRATIVAPTRRSRKPLLAAAGAAALLAAGVIGFWALPSLSDDDPAAGTSPTSVAPPQSPSAQKPEDLAEVTRMLPRGYRSDSCLPPDIAEAGGVATVQCGPNTDPGGPLSATYTLFRSTAALNSAFEEAMGHYERVVCPGNIQSPGTWRKSSDLERSAGTLFCGTQGGQPTIIWTNSAHQLLSTVHSGPGGATFDQLYSWWAKHS